MAYQVQEKDGSITNYNTLNEAIFGSAKTGGQVVNSQAPKDANPNADYNFQGYNYLLVDFEDDLNNTIYLYDKPNKTYRGFESTNAAINYLTKLGIPMENIASRINTINSSQLNNDSWKGNILDWQYTIKEDGTSIKETPEYQDTSSLSTIYGKQKAPTETEQWVGNIIGATLTSLKLDGLISETAFDKYVKDATQLAKYMNAALYGDYTIGDIYKDIKIKEMADMGIQKYKGLKGVDENITAENFYNSEIGKQVANDVSISVPADISSLDSNLLNYTVYNIPGQAFKTIIKPIDINSEEFKEEAEKIQASYYDLMMQTAEAITEQDKAIALDNWNRFKDNIDKKYGIELSNNASTAWNQLKELSSGYSAANIGDSGLFKEALDNQLKDTRRGDQFLRDYKASEMDLEERNNLLTSGTAEKINAFIQANPEKAEQYGLKPSAEIANWYSRDNLKSLYPDMKDAEIQAIIDTVLDENGNYRSQLYQNLYANKYDLGEQKKAYQESKLYEQKLVEENKAYAPYTEAENPLSSYAPEYAKTNEDIKEYVESSPNSVTSPQGTPAKYSEDGTRVYDYLNKQYKPVAGSAPVSVTNTQIQSIAPKAVTTPTATQPTAPTSFKSSSEQKAYDEARIAANRQAIPVTGNAPTKDQFKDISNYNIAAYRYKTGKDYSDLLGK